MSLSHVPTPQQERIKVIDVVRGFALFGVFLVNTAMFNTTMLSADTSALSNPWLAANSFEWLSGLFIQVFGEGKFYTIFSFLFGLGFYLFEKRAEAKGLNAKALFKRRLGFLLLFGICNFSLIWYGDILHAYALMGFCMIPFYKCQPKTICIWAVGLLTVFILTFGAFSMLNEQTTSTNTSVATEGDAGDLFLAAIEKEMDSVYQEGSYLETIKFRVTTESWFVLLSLFFVGPKILAMFLFGLYVGKKDWIPRLSAYKVQLQQFFMVTAVLAVFSTLAFVCLQAGTFGKLGVLGLYVKYVLKEFSVVVMAAAYASGIAYMHLNGLFANLFYRLGCVGQMALTNYLVQCFLLSWLFYGHGLGLMNFLPLWGGIGITFIFFGIQMFYSPIWLNLHAQGPCEKLWRKLTYLKVKMETR